MLFGHFSRKEKAAEQIGWHGLTREEVKELKDLKKQREEEKKTRKVGWHGLTSGEVAEIKKIQKKAKNNIETKTKS